MKISFITLFPEMCHSVMKTGVIGRGIDKGIIKFETVNPRDFCTDNYASVDDTPYGGGPGMVIKAEPVVKAYESIEKTDKTRTFITVPGGKTFNQKDAELLSNEEHIIFICGRYEGIDERVKELIQPEEISLGDYILTGGELAALSIADASCRLIKGTLGSYDSTICESFSTATPGIEHPQYTRPQSFRGLDVPDVLLSGNHAAIESWRAESSHKITEHKRPDLLKKNHTEQLVTQ
jgi:tRNA (guanine37-N1)-methyltransferase